MAADEPRRDRAVGLNRREFLGGIGGGALAAVLSSPATGQAGAGPGHEAQWEMKLSTSTVQFSSLGVEEACRRISDLGFTGVDLWSAYQGCPHLDDCVNRLGPAGLTDLLESARLSLTAFSVYVGGFAKYAKLLGEVGGAVAIRGSSGPCAAEDLTARMQGFLETLKPLAELAEETSSFLAIENHGDALLNSLDSLKAFTDLNRSSRLGIALAPYHLQATGAPVPEAIRICGRQLLFFYAWQKEPGLKQLPGIGSTDFAPWVRALARAGYAGYVNPFMHGHPETAEMCEALAQAKSYLESCDRKA